MTERIIGPTGSPRRRWTLLVPLTLAIVVGLFYISGAQAVHDDGVFELDGNAVAQATPGEDWSQICLPAEGPGCSGPSATPNAQSFQDDGASNATIFSGGGSKDDHDIDDWEWKNESGGLPDKDNLTHAYAARYRAEIDASHAGLETLLYFGADRFDNSGDAQIGFWFLQGEVGLITGSGGGSKNTFGPDAHTVGDILVLSDFTGGGTDPTIRVFMWNPGAPGAIDGVLVPLAGGLTTPAECGSASQDDFCAITNAADGTTAPWTFLNKDNQTSFGEAEFYEGGINLSSPVFPPSLQTECFATFAAETRASSSVDATLKDFILDQFAPCEAGINTVPSPGSGGSVVFGSTVTDTATVTGVGGGTPTGTVKFWVCNPSQLNDPSPTDDPALCDVGGTFVDVNSDEPNGELLQAVDATTATATSDGVTVNVAGTWCFRGEYVPAAGSPYAADTDFDSSECFSVTQLQPTIQTVQTYTLKDTATITVGTGAGNLAGSVRFRLYTTSNCSGTALYDSNTNFPNGIVVSGASPQSVDSETITITTTATNLSWLVEYTSTNQGHLNVTSACNTEHSSVTIVNS